MSAFPGSPRLLKAGLVLLDPDQFTPLANGIIVLQYNPETLTRSYKVKGIQESGDRSEALRVTGPPVESRRVATIAPARGQEIR